MTTPGITKDQVFTAIETLLKSGQSLTLQLIREELKGGSFSTISKHLAEWKETQSKQTIDLPEIPQEVTGYIKKIWMTAYQESNKLLESEREALKIERIRLKEQHDSLLGAIVRVEEERDGERANVMRLERQNEELKKQLEEKEKIAQELPILRHQYTTAEERRIEAVARAERAEERLAQLQRDFFSQSEKK
ncbi:MAG: DNA-binding protein [Oligoflexia bacterium]|nr:DNA-binding protein [Oligoflexia bacterium]